MPALQPIDDLSAAVRDELTAPWSELYPIISNAGRPYGYVRRETTFAQAVQSPAQARVRMAYFLSQVCVISDQHPELHANTRLVERYWDLLMSNALGPYKDVLMAVTLAPQQLFYLTLLNSRKADDEGVAPDENYARELLQLFTLGKDELDADGRRTGRDTYERRDVAEVARLLTGLAMPIYSADGGFIHNLYYDRTQPRDAQEVYAYHHHHDFEQVSFLGRTIGSDQALYEGIRDRDDWQTALARSLEDRPYPPYDGNPDSDDANILEMIALMKGRIEKLIDVLVEHPNTVRNLARQMIGHHVTRDYSGAYFRRVVAAGETGTYQLPDGSVVGTGERLDLAAMFAAVRLDPEALADPASRGRLWGRHRPAHLSACAAIRPLLAASEVAPVSRSIRMDNVAGGVGDAQWSTTCRTAPLTAPSVFSFFEYTYAPPTDDYDGTDVFGSELQVVDTQSVVAFPAWLAGVAASMTPTSLLDNSANVSDPNVIWSLDLSRFLDAADDAGALARLLDLEFTGETLEPETRALVADVIEGVPPSAPDGGLTTEDRFARFRAAWIAVCASTEFQTQR